MVEVKVGTHIGVLGMTLNCPSVLPFLGVLNTTLNCSSVHPFSLGRKRSLCPCPGHDSKLPTSFTESSSLSL